MIDDWLTETRLAPAHAGAALPVPLQEAVDPERYWLPDRGGRLGSASSLGLADRQLLMRAEWGCRYKTPDLNDIDQVGIKPDSSCQLPGQEAVAVPKQQRFSITASDLEGDSCLLAAKEILKTQLPHPS